MKAVIVYDSLGGNTEKVAKRIHTTLVEGGVESDIIKVTDADVQPAPNMEGEIKDEFINGLVGSSGKMLVLLDTEKLFEDDSLKKVENIKG